MYDPTFKQDPLPSCNAKEKFALDPNYYPQGYISEEQEEEAPILVNDLVNSLEKNTPEDPVAEEDEVKKEQSKDNKEEEDGRESTKTQVNSGQGKRGGGHLLWLLWLRIYLLKTFSKRELN